MYMIKQEMKIAGCHLYWYDIFKSSPPEGVNRIDVETAWQMQSAVRKAMPADVAVCVAAVADWRVEQAGGEKIKKTKGALPNLGAAGQNWYSTSQS